MSFLIEPFEAAGAIEFGMHFSDVRKLMGPCEKSFKRNGFEKFPTDMYQKKGFFVCYDETGKVEAVEFFPPSNPCYDNVELLNNEYNFIINLINKKDGLIEISSNGFISYGLGIGAYCSSAEDDSSSFPESIIVFKKGYYD